MFYRKESGERQILYNFPLRLCPFAVINRSKYYLS
jgi:hypothetical protein